MVRIVWNTGKYDYILSRYLPYYIKKGLVAYVLSIPAPKEEDK